MKNKIIIYLMVGILCLLNGCKHNGIGTQEPNNTNIEQIETKEISEDMEITDEFLEKKYPGKHIIHWVYGENMKLTKEDIEFGEKYGTHSITNEQVIRLNDYLTSVGKDYVINYSRMGCGEEYIKEVQEMAKNNNAPDIITAAPFLDFNGDTKYRVLKYDFISAGLLEELTPYLENELKEYINSVPENVYKLSRVNGKFYGYDGGMSNESSVSQSIYWYVNTDLAKKYDIDVDKMEQMEYEEWRPYLKKVYDGEKKKGTEDFKMIADYAAPLFGNHILGYIGSLNGINCVKTNAFKINLENGKINNFYKDENVKNAYSAYAEYYKNGYFKFLNPTNKNNTGNGFLFMNSNISKKDALNYIQVDYPEVKNIKKIRYCEIFDFSESESSGVTGICSKSKNKSMAMDALNFIFSDETASNITKYPQYEVGDKNFSISESDMNISDYDNYAGPSNLLTNPFVAIQYAEYDVKDIIKSIESVSINDEIAGKIFDYSEIENEIKEIISIEEKYFGDSDICNGKITKGDFEEQWSSLLESLDKAGMDKAIKVLNEQ